MNAPIQTSTMPYFKKSLRWNTNRKYLDHITPTELQRNIDLEEDKLNHLKEIKSCNIIDKETERKINNETDEEK